LDILDTAGQEEYSVMRDQYIRAGEGFLLCYSITSKGSFETISHLRDKILMVKDVEPTGYFPMVVVGNKSDMETEREVPKVDLENLGKTWKCPVLEISAKARLNIEEAFMQVVREVRNTIHVKGPNPVKPKKRALKCTLF